MEDNRSNSEPTKNTAESDAEIASHERYWKDNIKLIFFCLFFWFLISFGFGVLWVDALNEIRLGGFKLGFWFAQQGSIYGFLVIIIFYIRQMRKLDEKYHVED